MKRLDFIRKSILAAAGIAIAPTVLKEITEEVDVIHLAIKQIKLMNVSNFKTCIIHFKVTDKVLEDNEWLNHEIEVATTMSNLPENAKLVNAEVGLIDDDFAFNMKTVRLEFA